jgi:hypothetical protein
MAVLFTKKGISVVVQTENDLFITLV